MDGSTNQATFDKSALKLLQGRVACKLAEIHQMLAPGISAPVTPELLQAHADRHMASLSPAAQERLRLQALVAFAELQRLSAEMTRHLDALTVEMNKVARHRRAAVAYRQVAPVAAYGAARL